MINRILQLLAYIRFKLGVKPKRFIIPKGYHLVETNFKDWYKKCSWWQSNCYFTEDAVKVSGDNKEVKLLTYIKGNNPYSGYMCTNKHYLYGIFKCKIKLPIGEKCWSAFWLTSPKGWKNEIDILESWNKDTLFPQVIKANLHKIDRVHKAYHAYNIKLDYNQYIDAVCVWTKHSIKIYYNGYLVAIWFTHIPHTELMLVLNSNLSKLPVYDTYSETLVKDLEIWQKVN